MKVFIISHISDPDGVTPVILSKLIFDDVDSLLVEAANVNDKVLQLINNHELDKYDLIYITDLGLNEQVCNLIDSDNNLKTKIKVFDHHVGNAFANKYSFTSVIDIDENGKKQSGTSLYYEYLLKTYDNDYLKKEAVSYFVNLVREYDVWEWVSTNNEDAKRLNNLFDLYGRKYFEEHYLSFLKDTDTFFFDDKELFLLEIEQRTIQTYIEDKKSKVIPISILGHRACIVFASKYRSELGNALAEYFKDIYDFVVIINIERSISYRGVKNIDLNDIAKVFGGKGHINSCGSPLPNDIKENIINFIFGDKVTTDNNL